MRLHIFSDLHIDFNQSMASHKLVDDTTEADAAIVAGDTRHGLAAGLKYLRKRFPAPKPLIVIAGNHEFYGSDRATELTAGRMAAAHLDIHFLENETVVLGGVRFLGATLWTDYDFWGEETRDVAMDAARIGLNDHRLIAAAPGSPMAFQPEVARNLHVASRRFLKLTLQQPFPGPTVVVTHHLPHEKSLNRRFAADPLTAAFVSDLSELIAFQPELWVHGHTHTSFDYRVGLTRVLCNPRGYGTENGAYDPGLVVEV